MAAISAARNRLAEEEASRVGAACNLGALAAAVGAA